MAENAGVRKSSRKVRSKSLGPGGLDALLNAEKKGESSSTGTGKPRKRRESMIPASQVKSILLPTVPVSPRPLPARSSMGRRRTSLLNIPSLNLPPKTGSSTSPLFGANEKSNGMTTSIPLRTEEEQAAAARERQKKEILASRAERRKSLGNRRVSFATEATLHTFVVEEYPATPSFAGGPSRDSTPGQSSTKKGQRKKDNITGPEPSSDSDSESDSNEDFSSPISPSDELGRLIGPGEHVDNSSSSDSDESGSDYEDTLSGKKMKAVQLAAGENKNNTFPDFKPMDFDEDEEMAMDVVKENEPDGGKKGFRNFFKKPITVIRGDLPPENSSKKAVQVGDEGGEAGMESTRQVMGLLSNPAPEEDKDDDDGVDMDVTRPVGGLLFTNKQLPKSVTVQDDDGEMTMDVTRPIGGLIASVRQAAQQLQKHLRPSALFGAASDNEDDGEADMDITRAVGGLVSETQQKQQGSVEVQYPSLPSDDQDDDEMDITRPVGGLLKSVEYPSLPQHQQVEEESSDTEMDITRPLGGILAKGKPRNSDNDDQTMDMTVAIGKIKQKATWSQDEEEDGSEADEMTMDLTMAVGGINKTASSHSAQKKGSRRRSSTIGAVVLQSAKDWEKSQEAERQLQKEAQEEQKETAYEDEDMEMTVAVGGILDKEAQTQEQKSDQHKGKQSGTLLEVDDDVDMDIENEMEFTAIIPSGIMQKSQSPDAPVQESASTPQKSNVDIPAPAKQTTPASQKAARTGLLSTTTPANKSYGTRGTESVSSLPSPGGGWIPPLQRPNRFYSANNTPTEANAQLNSASIAAALASPSANRNNTLPIPSEAPKPNSPKKRVTRSSLAKGRASLSSQPVEQPPAVVEELVTASTLARTSGRVTRRSLRNSDGNEVADAAQEVQITPQQPSTPEVSAPEVTTPQATSKSQSASSFETPPRRQPELGDGFTLSARRRLAGLPNPSTPNATTPKRRVSGVGIDKVGLGSPSVIVSLSGRKSIGEGYTLDIGKNSPRDVLVESHRFVVEEKNEQKRKEEEAYLEQKRELDRAKDETLPLKERIQSMTPKKQNNKKRTSFEFEVESGVNRNLFGQPSDGSRQGNKRRSLGLDKPSVTVAIPQEPEQPAQMEGRVTRSRASLTGGIIPTPPPIDEDMAKKTTLEPTAPAPPSSAPEEPTPQSPPRLEEQHEEEIPKITMQQFLDMTSISFQDDITHTKRRQTFAPGQRRAMVHGPSALFKKKNKDGSVEPEAARGAFRDDEVEREPTLGDWITAGAATIVVYQLFYMSCRGLKQYIAEGKIQMKEIEKAVFAENPRLFREYMDSPADVKLIMDTQFKNIKTYARLVAKREWYDWRMKQLNEINEKLEGNFNGLKKDEESLTKQLAIVNDALPSALAARRAMKERLEKLVDRRKELEECDPNELAKAREKLVELRKEAERKKELVKKKREEVELLDIGIEERKERVKKLKEEIEEAERIKEMNRGFSEEEVWALRNSVRALEQKSGWSIVSLEGHTISMSYKKDLLLSFDATKPTAADLELVYIGGPENDPNIGYLPSKPVKSTPRLVEQQYFLELLQTRLKTVSTAREAIKLISRYWSATQKIVAQIAKARGQWMTECSFKPELNESGKKLLVVCVKVILPEKQAKIQVQFSVDGIALFRDGGREDVLTSEGFTGVVEVLAKPIYCVGAYRMSQDALNGKLRGGVTGSSAMGLGSGWKGVVDDVVKKCFETEQPLQPSKRNMNQQQPQQTAANTKATTPRKPRPNIQTPGKKIPVRAAAIEPVSTAASATATTATSTQHSHSARSINKPPAISAKESIPFEKVTAPFGTGKRGIPVPTKAAHEDREGR